jgi:hypothetical protein
METSESSLESLREKPLLDEAAAVFLRLLVTCECSEDRLLVIDVVRLLIVRHR